MSWGLRIRRTSKGIAGFLPMFAGKKLSPSSPSLSLSIYIYIYIYNYIHIYWKTHTYQKKRMISTNSSRMWFASPLSRVSSGTVPSWPWRWSMRTWPGKRPKWRWCCRLEPGTCDPALWAQCGGCSWGPGGEKRKQGSTDLWGALSCGAFFSKKYCLDLGKFFVFRGMFNGQVSRGLVNQWKINQFSMLWTAISYPISWRWIGKK